MTSVSVSEKAGLHSVASLIPQSQGNSAGAVVQRVLGLLNGVRRSGKGWSALCPAHQDSKPSLSVGEGNDGRALLTCHRGCPLESVVAALGLSTRDLFADRRAEHPAFQPRRSATRTVVASYDYVDEYGKLLHQTLRYDPKEFRQRRPDGNGGWTWNLKDSRVVLYRLPELLEAVSLGKPVFVVEGEKDVDRLAEAGIVATTNPMGAGKWRSEFSQYFVGANVVVLPDNDTAGRSHARTVAVSLADVAASVGIVELPGLPLKGDVTDWLQLRSAEDLRFVVEQQTSQSESSCSATRSYTLDDFYAVMPLHQYIFTPTLELWPAISVDNSVKSPSQGRSACRPSAWLDKNRRVEQLTWAPGHPMIIRNRLIDNGGWIEEHGCSCFNLYRPPCVLLGDANAATPWLEHVHRVYPQEAEHIVQWLAHRVQRPGEKVNHALLLGGAQGIGKDSILEPVKACVGPWNFEEISASNLLGRFNKFVKSVILRINEARDLGEIDRYAFYEHLKTYTAAPPEVLRCDEKNVREYAVVNVCGVILTTNHRTNGIYLPPDDRRHFVAWSDVTVSDVGASYFRNLHTWYLRGGNGHVAAHLTNVDLSGFDAKAPPPKTAAFWDIVDSNRAPEDAELSDALDRLNQPRATTLRLIASRSDPTFAAWLADRRNSRQIPHRLESVGYTPFRNDGAQDGRWKIGERRQVVYVRRELSTNERHEAIKELFLLGEAAR